MEVRQINPSRSATSGGRWARLTFLLLVGWALCGPELSATATDITSCGETVAAAETGVLQADLDCSSNPFGVRLLREATLDLNGHSIAGGTATLATVLGASVVNDADLAHSGRGNFTIVGPGEISGVHPVPALGQGTFGCVVLGNGRARITSTTGVVDIHNCGCGVMGRLEENSTNHARAEIDHVTVHDNLSEGTCVGRLVASDVTSYNHAGGIGLQANGSMLVTNVAAHDNGIGIFGTSRVRGTNVVATGNGNGVESFRRVYLINLVATNSTALFGVSAPRIRLTDSTVTGSARADIASRYRPRLVNTTCGTSLDYNSGTWGVCAND